MVSPLGLIAKAQNDLPNWCKCGLMVSTEISASIVYRVVCLVTLLDGTTKGGTI